MKNIEKILKNVEKIKISKIPPVKIFVLCIPFRSQKLDFLRQFGRLTVKNLGMVPLTAGWADTIDSLSQQTRISYLGNS
mgnify:CR=1 FL=1